MAARNETQPPASPAKQSSSLYLTWIDLMKGTAIIGIILFHLFQNYPSSEPLVDALDRLGAKVGFAGVDIFFTIAGFNTSYSFAKKGIEKFGFAAFNWGPWLASRIKRLYPTYWLACAFVLLTYLVFNYEVCGVQSVKFWLSLVGWGGYVFQCINPGFWFFTAILQGYLITPILFAATGGRARRLLGLTLAIALAVKVVCFLIPESSPGYYPMLQNNFIGSYIGQYGIGLYLGKRFFESGAQFSLRTVCVSLGVFALSLVLYLQLEISGQNFNYKSGFDVLFAPAFFFIGYYFFDKFFTRVNLPIVRPALRFAIERPLAFIGKNSYPVYLVHQAILFVALPRFVRGIPLDGYGEIATIAILASLAVAVYCGLFMWLDARTLAALFRKQKAA